MADKIMYRPKAVLGCQTNFSFLSGASHPEELVAHAHHLGWQAVGIADRFSCGGLVRAHMAIKDIAAQNNPDCSEPQYPLSPYAHAPARHS